MDVKRDYITSGEYHLSYQMLHCHSFVTEKTSIDTEIKRVATFTCAIF